MSSTRYAADPPAVLDVYIKDGYQYAPPREFCACGGMIEPTGISQQSITFAVRRHQQTPMHLEWRDIQSIDFPWFIQ